MTFVYENICGEAGLEDLSKCFDNSFKVKDFDRSIPDEPGVFLGSIEGNRWVQKNRPFLKTWSTFEKYECSVYYPIMGDLLFNDKYAFIPFKELSRRKWDLYSWLGKQSLVFIRPNSGEKEVPAELVDLQDIDKLVENYDYEGLAVVSTPKNSIGEWRFVVSQDGVVAVSLYKYQGIQTEVPSAPPQAYDLVNKVLKLGWFPDEIFCVDVVQDIDYDCHVMEITSFSSAGLYACDKEKVANAIKKHW